MIGTLFWWALMSMSSRPPIHPTQGVKVVKYGRTIEVGQFGRGRDSERVWFGWETAVQPGETPAQALDRLRVLADATTQEERKLFDGRKRW